MEDVREKPDFSVDDAVGIALQHFEIQGAATVLPGERDQNFKISGALGNYVLKIAHPNVSHSILEMENSAIRLAGEREPANREFLAVPTLVRSRTGESIVGLTDANSRDFFVRCLSYLPGQPLANVGPHSPALLELIGRLLGELDLRLEVLEDNSAAKREMKWDLKNALQIVTQSVSTIEDLTRRSLLNRFVENYLQIEPTVHSLRQSVIHNDANDYNILVHRDELSGNSTIGLIDFGDMVYSTTIHDLAICGAYIMLDKPDPVAAAASLVAGYHQSIQLGDAELTALFPLMCMRLCQSVCIAANQQLLEPSNAYLGVSEQPAWNALKRLAEIDPAEVRSQFTQTCRGADFLFAVPDDGIKSPEIEVLRQKHLAPSLSLSYEKPLHIVRGKGQYLYDADGKQYLDCVNNVCHVGHCRVEVVQAAIDQMSRLNTNTRYLHENIVRYAERLTATLPDPLDVCFFVNSGSEANDLALRLARAYCGHHDVIVIDHAYHGHLSSLIELSPYKFNRRGGSGCPNHTHVVPIPDGFRGPFRYDDPDYGRSYALQAKTVIERAKSNDRKIAAFFAESLLGCGGQIPLPDNYLGHVYGSVREAGGVCIADEVQVGFGRVGTHFWGFQQQHVVPDIVTMGKPIGNGHPLAAVVTSREIAEAFDSGMEYFNTFGGNPVSCAVGMAVLDVIENEHLQEQALDLGSWLLERLGQIKAEFDCVGDVRGSGLFLGIELIQDQDRLTPAADLARSVVERMKRKQILLSTDGPFENVIKFKPPMVFNRDDGERLLTTLQNSLKELTEVNGNNE